MYLIKIKELVHPLKKNDEEFIKLKYIEREERRVDLVNKLQEYRRRLKKTDVKVKPSSNLKQSKSYSKIGKLASCHIKLLKGNIIYNKGLNKELISKEEKKAMAITANELKNIVVKLRNDYAIKECKKTNSCSKQFFNNYLHNSTDKLRGITTNKKARESFSNTMKLKGSVEICERRSRQDSIIAEWKKSQGKLKRSKKMLFEIKEDRRKEQRDSLIRKEKYRQTQLLQKIMKEDEKINRLRNQKEKVNKLRQEMRKNANYNKYKAREELEKIVLKQDKTDTKLMSEMLETAGLGQVWQLINKVNIKP